MDDRCELYDTCLFIKYYGDNAWTIRHNLRKRICQQKGKARHCYRRQEGSEFDNEAEGCCIHPWIAPNGDYVPNVHRRDRRLSPAARRRLLRRRRTAMPDAPPPP